MIFATILNSIAIFMLLIYCLRQISNRINGRKSSPILSKIKNFLKKSWEEGTQIGKANIYAAVFLGGGAHLSLYFIYKFYFGLYENIYLRIVTLFLCLTVGFYYKLAPKIQKTFFPFYWHLMLIMALPFMLSFNLFKTNFNEAWLYWEIFMIFLLALYVPNWFIFIIDLVIGVGAAFLAYLLSTPTFDLDPNFNIESYLIVFSFSGIAGIGFVYGNRMTWLQKQDAQHKALTAMAGSIVHEIRNPLNAINLASSSGIKTLKSSHINNQEKMARILEYKNNIVASVSQANAIINIALSDLHNKPITKNQITYLKTDEILLKVIAEYGYKNETEKEKVKLDTSKNNFIFKAIPERFTFIIYNLLKNSLYYLKSYPNSFVTIGTEERSVIDQENMEIKNYNVIFVHDTGPGIPEEIIPKLFTDFFTSGKKEGTGLGLAFCKRNMVLFGGDIICESEYGKNGNCGWTKFSMLFPKLTADEIQIAIKEIGKKKEKFIKILAVDDQQTILDTNKKILKKAFENIEIDFAKNGKDALYLFRYNNDYTTVLTDIEMPIMDGLELTRNIRKINKEIPIISYSSVKNYETKEKFNNAGIDCFFMKPISKRYLIRGIARWNLANSVVQKANIARIQDEKIIEKIKNFAKGKSIVLADDEALNVMLLKRSLLEYGFEVETFSSATDLFAEYLKNPKKHHLIISDINFGEEMMGYDMAKKIREYEKENNIYDPIPIIAYSGDGEQEKIYQFFRSGMTDYFVKGSDEKILIEKIIFYLSIDKKLSKEPDSEECSETYNFEDLEKIDVNSIKALPLITDHLDLALLNEIKNVFIEDVQILLEQIKKATLRKNIDDFYFHSHSLKGVAGNIGAKRLCEFVSYLNEFAKKQKFPNMENWLEELEDIFEDTKEILIKLPASS